ncbi:actin-related protein 2/3 complex, subunit 5 [Acrasis kona]|uniref:Actin-related protein 2/3 complex subunit 5 n=1 Tax=Acrasis kona TaxID=1008807 RepID=A0AAW2Z240_9EUKA
MSKEDSDNRDYVKELAEREKVVSGLVRKDDKKGALVEALKDAPMGAKDDKVKIDSAAVVYQVLSSAKDTEIDALVEGLDADQQDLLMKYVYRCLSTGESASSNILFKWHKAVVGKAGMGAVVRVLTERKTV